MAKKPEPSHRPTPSDNEKKRERDGRAHLDTVDRDSDDSFPASDLPSTTPVTGPRRDHER